MQKKDNVRINMKEPMKLGLFNGQNFRCAVNVNEDYRPYRHKSRTLFFITQGRVQSKTLILSTDADQKSIKHDFYCHLSPDRQSLTPFLAIIIRVRRLVSAFSIAAYPVCLISILHELCALLDVVSFSNYE